MVNHLQLTDHFLIAMPGLHDPNFFHTVTYICEHNLQGAMGVIINRPTELTLADLGEQLNITMDIPEIAQMPLYHGGPVEMERGFVLHSPIGEWDSTIPINAEMGLTMSQDIIQAIADGIGPQHFLVALGYAGWGDGQLEDELAENAWLTGPASQSIIFNTPIEQRWNAAASSMGVQLDRLSTDIGHA